LYAYILRQFYTDCSILGTVDYIFGNSAAVFQNCKLLARTGLQGSQNTYTASGRTDPAQPTGFSFLSCTLEGAVPAASTWPTYLGRPWKPYARTVFIESTLGSLIEPAGWLLWNGDQQSGDKVTYGEYSNTGPGSNTAHRVRWSMQLTSKQAFTYTVSNFIDGENWLPATSISFSGNL
jgi:pectinesterase